MRTRRVWAAAYVLAAAGLTALALAVPALYLVDLPAWVYQGALLRAELADAAATPWALARVPVPNALAALAPAALLGALTPHAAGRVLGAGLLAGGFAAAWALGRAAEPGGPAAAGAARAAIVASGLVASSSFWNGYVGFQMGVVLALGVGAVWLRRGRLPPLAVCAATLALFAAHAVPFAVVALALGLDALHRRDARTVAALVPAAVLTALYVFGRAAAVSFEPATEAGGLGRALAYKAYTVLKLGPLTRPAGLDGSALLSGVPLGLALAAAGLFVAALAVALAAGTARMEPGGPRRAALYAWAVAGVALVLPPFALNVVNPGERVLAMAAAGLLAVVPLPRRTVLGLGAVALLFLADDAAALWSQRTAIPPAERAATYARRAAAERADRPVDATFATAARDAAARPAARLLRHDVRLHSDLYDAAARRDWTRDAFSSGVLVPDPAARR